ncbi:hypothetical protein WA158_000118 [Blastocystis sp. Blastoise]
MNSLENIKLISFDLDDTLWISNEALSNAEISVYNEIKSNYPKIPLSDTMTIKEEMHRLKVTNPEIKSNYTLLRKQAIRNIAKNTDYSIESLCDHLMEVFLDTRCKTQLFDNVIPMLSYLKSKGYILGIISNGNGDLRHHPELSSYFDFFVNPIIAGIAKPNKEIFQYAMKLTQIIDPSCCLHIGDSMEDDILGAYNAQWKSIYITNNKTITNDENLYNHIQPTLTFKSINDFIDHVTQVL